MSFYAFLPTDLETMTGFNSTPPLNSAKLPQQTPHSRLSVPRQETSPWEGLCLCGSFCFVSTLDSIGSHPRCESRYHESQGQPETHHVSRG